MSESYSDVSGSTTVLSLSGIGVPPYSARGLTQSLAPIDIASDNRRTINGDLKDLSVEQFRKYKSTIATGNAITDQQPPAVDGAWPGKIIVVECIAELSYVTSGGSPARPVVAGSSRVEGDFTFYRPELTMRVINFALTKDEYAGETSWTMDLEEV